MNCPSCGRENSTEANFCMACATSLVALAGQVPSSQVFPVSIGFVGRQLELGELRAALHDSLSGRGRFVMLAGEPGIGKTRTAQEVATYAELQGVQVLCGRCYDGEGAPPYWPWVQLLRSYVQRRDPEQLQAEMGPGAADIAEIMPDLREHLPDLESRPTLEPEQSRFRLFEAITNFLKRICQAQPLTLVLDDLHWADRSSLLLLEFIAREIEEVPLLVLGTYRDVEISRRHPLAETLGSLIREQRFLRVQLSGLAQQDVEQLIQGTAGVSPRPGLAVAIHQRTEGNPLFVTEIMRIMPGEGLGKDQDYLASIPEGVRDAIARRLNRLSEGCNQVLSTASVIGREFDFTLLSALRDDLTETLLLALIDEALEARVIEELPEGREVYQFTHALIQETLLSELSGSRRVRLHADIGQAMEKLYGAEAKGHADKLAYHFGEAGPGLGTEKVAHYALLAGERALQAYAHEEALAYFEQALVAKGVDPTGNEPAKDDETAAILFGRVKAQAASADNWQPSGDAASSLWRAFQYYTEVGDVNHAVAIAEFPDYTFRWTSVAEQLTTQALELVPPDSHEAGRLLCRRGQRLGIDRGDYEGAQSAFDQALVIARREGDTALETRILVDAAGVDAFHLRWREAVMKASMAIPLAQRADDLRAELNARYFAVSALTSLGELDESRRYGLAMLAPAERLRDRFWITGALWKSEISARLAGDWATAREYSDRCLEISPTRHSVLADQVMLECEVGEFGQAEAQLERFLEVTRGSGRAGARTSEYGYLAILIPLYARITGTFDGLEVAKEAAETALAIPNANPNSISRARIGLGLLAVLRNDIEMARDQFDALQLCRGSMLWWLISADRLLGLLAKTLDNPDQAADHFEDAWSFCHQAGYRPELAWTCHDYADTLLQRGGPGDLEKARALLDEAMSVSQELGMTPLMERVTRLQERTESPSVLAPSYPDGLTHREVEVLHLIALGKSNREIAEDLTISLNTVLRHVSHILAKTGAANRVEAVGYAAREGLVSL